MLFCGLVAGSSAQNAWAQQWIPDTTNRYRKTVEADPMALAKTAWDERFFGDFNAEVEFLLEPTCGVRLFRDSDSAWVLEVKRVTNQKEVDARLSEEFPLRGIAADKLSSMSQEEIEQNAEYNQQMVRSAAAEQLKQYRIESRRIPVSDDWSKQLYARTVEQVGSALPGPVEVTCLGGHELTFRCKTEENGVWTLKCLMPEGELKALSDLYRRMIADVENGTFEEQKYVEASDSRDNLIVQAF